MPCYCVHVCSLCAHYNSYVVKPFKVSSFTLAMYSCGLPSSPDLDQLQES